MKIHALEGGPSAWPAPLSQSRSPQGQESTRRSGEGNTLITPLLLSLLAAQASAGPGQLGSSHLRLACPSGGPWMAGGAECGSGRTMGLPLPPPPPPQVERTVGLQQGRGDWAPPSCGYGHLHLCDGDGQFTYSLLKNIYFIDFLQGGRERDRELETLMREKHQLAASCTPPTGDVSATKVHALDWNRTGDPLVHRPMLYPLSQTG
uniref:Uncharacterized protein n=1 Tax=Myotis myotis TaxID=51298 RepID=A0A7J7XH19_MYOMY|nr:hypothetical protein mMyoMyo1_011597 [Myotis myotis]